MSRARILRSTQILIDVAVLSVALFLAFAVRFDWSIPRDMFRRFLILWPYVVALQYALLALLGIPRFAWRYVGLRETTRILTASVVASAVLIAVRVTVGDILPVRGYYQYAYLPLGVIAINLPLAFLGTVGVRVIRRISTERAETKRLRTDGTTVVRTLLVGAGRAGVMVAKEIAGRPELGILPVGFIDDDAVKHGTVVHGIPVLGGMSEMQRIARQRGVSQAIITVSNAPGTVVREIASACQRAGLRVKVVPGLYQLVGGDVNLKRIRDIAIEDLLRRDAVVLDDAAIAGDLRGAVVFVTGAGGSIGSEICRQVCRFEPKELVLLERSENALFEIHRELTEANPSLRVRPCIVDICDADRLSEVFSECAPDVVFHAAAHKHVPMMEWNPAEAVKNNVLGTRTLADTAHAAKARAFVMISTDKAVNPSSVMGATKRAAELYVQALGRSSKTRFVTVRFGNVLGSNGSVVPIFQQQIARGGPVTVTHPDMKRYFMTIPEACQLVLQAGAMGKGGEIFILDMGEPVRIVDLARDLIQLSGFAEGEIEIQFTGIRPGEKLYEELSMGAENAERTRHPKVFIGKTLAAPLEVVSLDLQRLSAAVRAPDAKQIRAALQAMVPEYRSEPPSASSGVRLQAEPVVQPARIAAAML